MYSRSDTVQNYMLCMYDLGQPQSRYNSRPHVHRKLDMGHSNISASLKFDIFVLGKVFNRLSYRYCTIRAMKHCLEHCCKSQYSFWLILIALDICALLWLDLQIWRTSLLCGVKVRGKAKVYYNLLT